MNAGSKERNELIGLSLQQKIDHAVKILGQALERFPTGTVYLGWTGGKDSTLMLWLMKQACSKSGAGLPSALVLDEGGSFPEIESFISETAGLWGLRVLKSENRDLLNRVTSPGDVLPVSDLNPENRAELEKLGHTDEYLVFEPESFVVNHLLKTVALNNFLAQNKAQALCTAIRWDEQPARLAEDYFSPRDSPAHIRVHPILHFSEKDVWRTIRENQIPFCPLYAMGYRSLGAKNSTVRTSNIPAWEQDLDQSPERAGRGREKEIIMAKLRSLGYM